MVNSWTILPIVAFILLLLVLYWLQRRQVALNRRIFISLVLGILLGFTLQSIYGHDNSALAYSKQAFHLIGAGYLALLKMLVIPLILTSIIAALLNLGDLKGKLIKNLSLRSVGMLLILTSIASAIGIGIGVLFNVGQGLSLPSVWQAPSHPYTGFVNTILGLLPTNPVAAMTNGNTVAIVIFAVLLGVAALLLHKDGSEKSDPFKNFMNSAFLVTKKLAVIVISLTPYGVLALMAQITATQGLSSLTGIANYMGAMYVAMIIVICMHLLISSFFGYSPIKYFKRI